MSSTMVTVWVRGLPPCVGAGTDWPMSMTTGGARGSMGTRGRLSPLALEQQAQGDGWRQCGTAARSTPSSPGSPLDAL
jgi:hypothetical protein